MVDAANADAILSSDAMQSWNAPWAVGKLPPKHFLKRKISHGFWWGITWVNHGEAQQKHGGLKSG